jgi:hypothetical protein
MLLWHCPPLLHSRAPACSRRRTLHNLRPMPSTHQLFLRRHVALRLVPLLLGLLLLVGDGLLAAELQRHLGAASARTCALSHMSARIRATALTLDMRNSR